MIALRFLSLAVVVLFFGAAYSSPVPAPTQPAPTHTPKPTIAIASGVSI